MKKIFRVNLFAMIIIITEILIALGSSMLYEKLNMGLYSFMGLLNIVMILIPLIIYFIITKQPFKETMKFRKIDIVDIILVILIAIFIQPVASFLSLIMTYIFPNNISSILSLGDAPLYLKLIVIALMPAVLEEMCVRGVILSGYEDVSLKKAAIATGFIFAMMHVNPQAILYTFVLGVLLAYLVYITGSIFSSMICHFTINAMQTITAQQLSKNISSQAQSANSIMEYSVPYRVSVTIVVGIIAIVALLIVKMLMKKLAKHHNFDLNDNTRNVSSIKKINQAERRVDAPNYYVDGNINSIVDIEENNEKEKIINLPYIVMIIIYVSVAIINLLR